MDIFRLDGKTALVTGCTRGIGAAMAVALAEAGADIVMIQVGDARSDTQTQIESLGRKCDTVIADLSSRATIRNLIPQITATHKIDILVNNAGIMKRHTAVDFPEEDFDEVMEVNFNCTFLLCQGIGRYWNENGIKGRLINTASLATFQGGVRMAAYAGSKGAVGQLTKALSNEWAQYIATDMNIDTRTNSDQTYYNSILTRIPAGHWGEPKDFKGPVVFLASEASSYITGHNLTACQGGRRMDGEMMPQSRIGHASG
ncbi:enoyl-(Acyl carrier protein) reductase domain-containing protein [Sarocladium implicatum]|nr:enoyl-(Acyl carrier protein) reductase domain-containing protein [Sarocladium implicatum]